MENRRVLLIAGSDSSGGAGLEADQKVMAAHKCYAMTATTALTAQNTKGVLDVYPIPSDFVIKQIDACITDIGVEVVKIGMLASTDTVGAVASVLRKHGRPTCVVDPVMVATTGAQLLPDAAVSHLRNLVLPLTTILTPNIPEAQLLLQNAGIDAPEITSVHDIIAVARKLQALGPSYVLVKGGHLPLTSDLKISATPTDRTNVVDVLHDGEEATVFSTNFSSSKNTHGTGCSLASAIASNLAYKVPIAQAVENAIRYVEAGITTSSSNLGHGNGPISHFHSLEIASIPPCKTSLKRIDLPL